MPPPPKIPASLQNRVRQRAQDLCEYCHASEKWQYVQFTIDHVFPISQGGVTSFDNLALACFHCNRRKSDHITALDPILEGSVALFNPRRDTWGDHFMWSVDTLTIIDLTTIGRTTIAALQLNRTRIISIRAADRAVGRHPPSNDPIQRADE